MKHRIFGAVAAMLMIVAMVALAFSISAFASGETVEAENVDQLYEAINNSNVDKIILTADEYVLPDADTSVTVNRPLAIVGDDVGEKPVIKAECSGEKRVGLLTFVNGSAGSLIKNVRVEMSCPVGVSPRTYVVLFNNYTDSAEKTVIEDVDFVGGSTIDSIGSQIGIAASGSSTGGNVEVTGCTFTNFAYGLYLDNINGFTFTGNTINGTKYNALNLGEDGGSGIVISGNTMSNISYAGYEYDTYSSGIRIGALANAVTISENDITMLNEKSSLVVEHDGVMIGDTYYIGIEEALAAAKDNDVIKLSKGVAVNEMVSIGKSNLTFDLNGFTLTASEDFTSTWENGNDSHLLQILSASNVTVKNGKLVTTEKNKHALNIHESAGVVVDGVEIDHTLTRVGAPIVINASEVTVQGKLDLTVGEKSWYGINVDTREGTASLAFAAGSQVAMKNADGVADEKVIIKTDNESAGLNISGTTAAGIPADMIVGSSEDGTGHAHTPATEWSTDGEYHWYACTQDGCAITFEKVAHTFGEVEEIVDGGDSSKGTAVHECDVCKYKEEVYGIRYISDVGQLSDAIRDQKAGEVWYIRPGTYTLTKDHLDKYDEWANPENSSQTGWYFPIHENDITIIGETGENGERVIITSDVVTPNGDLPTQSFIAVWSDGVSIDNIDIKSKTVQNKAFEIFGKDFSLKNSKIVAVKYPSTDEYPSAEGKFYSGSIFFNPMGDDDSVGNAVLENIHMYAFISASYATAGNIDVSNITMDFSNNTWSAWGIGYGPAIVGNIYGKVEGITYLVDNDAVWEEIISAASPYYGDTKPGTVIKFTENITVDKMFDISRSDIVIDFNGFTLTASEDFASTYENDSHLVQISGDNVTVKNAKIVTTAKNKHGINIYQATGVVLENVTVDHTLCTKGAPIVINASDVTVKGKLDLTVGEKSWYGINVDPKEGTASLNFAEGSAVEMTGAKKYVMTVEGDETKVEITGAEEAGLDAAEDGSFHTLTGEVMFDETGHWEVCSTCDLKVNFHEHQISVAWTYDEENHWHQCLDCGYMTDVAPHNAIHAVEDDPYFVSDATCTEGKKYYRSCECGCSGGETFTVGDPLGHSWETVPAKDATCTEEGWNEHQACTVCGETEGKETVPALGHSLVKTDRKEADCVNAGNIEYYTCSVCGKIYRDADGTQEITKEQTVIAALGHRPGSFVVEREATCAQAGTQAKYCTVCNAEVEREEIPALAHTFGDWTVVKEATEKEKGQEERVCSVCQAKETRDIDALGGGLSTGAIVGIVVAVVVVLAGGGFCIYWFVIRKKKS